MATTNMRIVIRRDTTDNWSNNENVVLLSGEQGYVTEGADRGKMKVGDGVSMWKDLPYFAGGITGIDDDTIIMDAAGKIMLNEDSVIGDLGAAETVKEYVDLKDDALAAAIEAEAVARDAGDTALGARIDALTEASENGDTALAADLADSVSELVDAIEFEKSERMTADGGLQQQISLLTAGAADSVNTLDQKVEAYKGISDQQNISTNLRIDSLTGDLADSVSALEAADAAEASARADADDSIVGLLGDSVSALEAADAAEASARADADDSIVGLLGDSVTALEAADAAEAVLRLEGDESVAAMLQDSVDALELADAALATDLDDSVTALQDKALLLENLGIISATGADDTAVDGLESHDIYYNTNSETYRVKLYDGGVNSYTDANDAKTNGGLIVGQIYYNETVGALMTIMS